MSDRVAMSRETRSRRMARDQDVMLMSYLWSAVGGSDIKVLARRA